MRRLLTRLVAHPFKATLLPPPHGMRPAPLLQQLQWASGAAALATASALVMQHHAHAGLMPTCSAMAAPQPHTPAGDARVHMHEALAASCRLVVPTRSATGQAASSAPVLDPSRGVVLHALQNQRPATAAQGVHAPTDRPAVQFAEGSAYAVYDAGGQPSSLRSLLASLEQYDVVLLGEYHDDPVAHHLQHAVLRHMLQQQQQQRADADDSASMPGLQAPPGAQPGGSSSSPTAAVAAAACRPVVLSLEQFERDVQVVMDEYLAGGWVGGWVVGQACILATACPLRPLHRGPCAESIAGLLAYAAHAHCCGW